MNAEYRIYEDVLQEFIEQHIEQIDHKDWDAVYRDISKQYSVLVGRLTQLLWECDIHPEYDVVRLPDSFLAHADDISEWVVPDNIEQIGDSCFYRSALRHITIPDRVHTIGSKAFSQSDIVKIWLPSNLDVVSFGLCEGCEYLKSVRIPPNTQQISSASFRGCYALKEVTLLPETITHIGARAFEGCWSLEELSYESAQDEFKQYLPQVCDSNSISKIHCLDGDIIT